MYLTKSCRKFLPSTVQIQLVSPLENQSLSRPNIAKPHLFDRNPYVMVYCKNPHNTGYSIIPFIFTLNTRIFRHFVHCSTIHSPPKILLQCLTTFHFTASCTAHQQLQLFLQRGRGRGRKGTRRTIIGTGGFLAVWRLVVVGVGVVGMGVRKTET